ncbi:hypothetical protein F4859DRAFT_525265 [Xylaria cf. heliscus]|nr:hypothetical protein F4859DRAFT_525265 [Xylaria cf. heliscus]
MADALQGAAHPRPSTAIGRRKIRKGTTSCWEYILNHTGKRRKQRCHFAINQNRVCVSCQRRGKSCVMQQFDDPGYDLETHERIAADIEAYLESPGSLLETFQGDTTIDSIHNDVPFRPSVGSNNRSPGPSMQFFDSTLVNSSEHPTSVDLSILPSPRARRDTNLSRVLHASLPSQRDANLIIGASYTPAFLQFFTLPYQRLFSGDMQPAAELARLPGPTDHPVLLARELLYLAHGIQNLHPSTFDSSSLNLGYSPTIAMARYLKIASRLVTSNEALIESLEGLECLILEAVFYINSGNLRQAWLTFRRAIGLAQLMGVHLGRASGFTVWDPKSQSLPAMMWYRIVGQDRYLSLVLGLPPGTPEDLRFASQTEMPHDCATGQLERQHYDIMGTMAAQSARSGELLDDAFVERIDLALQRAVHNIPPEWWLIPRASYTMQGKGVDTVSNLEDVGRILVQINHYNLLVTLHLPSVLNSRGTQTDDREQITCLNSSRELLDRYIRLRCMRIAPFCCRMIDFSAFVACLALLSAHIARTKRGLNRMDALAHQRLSDRATVEEIIRLLLETSKADSDATLLQKAAAILRCLSTIETDALAGFNDSITPHATIPDRPNSRRNVRVKVPFLGTVTISAKGITNDLSERATEIDGFDLNANCWTHSLDLPLSPSVYFPQGYGDPNLFDPTLTNNIDEVISY